MAKFAKFIVALITAESLAASVAFLCVGNFKMAAYWFCVAGINAIAYTF